LISTVSELATHQDGPVATGQLQRLLLETETLSDFLTELTRRAATLTNHRCGITARGSSGPYTVASNDAKAMEMDGVQYAHDGGPCLQSLREGVPIYITDMAKETRWGSYPAHAMAVGVRSVLSYPITNGQEVLAALNLYAFDPLTPGVELQAQAVQRAGPFGGALELAIRLSEQTGLIGNLQTALTSRATTDQAAGILMAQQRCDAATAVDLLKQTSHRRNIKLRELCAQVITACSAS